MTLLISRLLVRPRLTWPDLAHLGFGQQNGITAILLALALEPRFPGTVGVVGPAIVTVNLLHHTFQWARVDRWRRDIPTAPEQQHAATAKRQELKPEPG
ncbi:hypothetical protein ACIPIU_07430 [Streptomyces massasporeus]|uniref:hypothetical protein n=1 Tax=Streptomyces massasporeus TaxID=67324 RepID=UPI003827854C